LGGLPGRVEGRRQGCPPPEGGLGGPRMCSACVSADL
jgi:hypothetical protein